jgi:hypothetical protein
MKVTITRDEEGCFRVDFGDRYAKQLTYDEMVWLVTSLLLPQNRLCVQWLKTKEQWDEWEEWLRSGGKSRELQQGEQ